VIPLQQGPVAADRDYLLDAHPAEHIQDLIADADRVQQVARLHGGAAEAGLGGVRAAEQHGHGLAHSGRVPSSRLRPVHRVGLAHGRTVPAGPDILDPPGAGVQASGSSICLL
jgi:hypothetical protein